MNSPGRSTVHPSEAEFERFAADELDAGARATLIEHSTACPECAAILRAVLELWRLHRATVPFASARRRTGWFAAAAAGLAAALWLVIARPFGVDSATDSFRATSRATIETLEPHGALARPPRIVRWQAWQGGQGDPGLEVQVEYRVLVVRDDGETVAERIVPAGAEPAVDWPDEAAAAGRYTWSVEARVDGERVARSRLVDVSW